MEKRVSAVGCVGYDHDRVREAVKACLEDFGGAKALLKNGSRVTIKTNLLMAASPDSAVTTHPMVLRALAEEFSSAGAQVTIADSPGGTYTDSALSRVYATCGLSWLSDVASLNRDLSYRKIRDERFFGENPVPVISPVLDADLVISAAKLKTHTFTGYTGAVKNLFGSIPGTAKAGYHAKFPKPEVFSSFLVSLSEYISPGFSIIDGIVGMEGNGPSGGKPKAANLLIGSSNPHAADLAGSYIMGFDPARLPTLHEAVKRGLVPENVSELEMVGEEIGRFRTSFEPPPAYGRFHMVTHTLPSYVKRTAQAFFKPYPESPMTAAAAGTAPVTARRRPLICRTSGRSSTIRTVFGAIAARSSATTRRFRSRAGKDDENNSSGKREN
jgi:uncharacterized protein (DUF362 family)